MRVHVTSPLCRRACPVITRREVWLPVPVPTRHRWGYAYQVSSWGRVRVVNPRTGTAKLLSTYPHPSTGYLAVSLGARKRVDGRSIGGCHLVHALVARAFLGPPPRDGRAWEVDHLGWDRTDAHVDGLRWLPKDVNQWRWKFYADEQPEEEREQPPMSPDELAAYTAVLRSNGWPEPQLPRPEDTHRHAVA